MGDKWLNLFSVRWHTRVRFQPPLATKPPAAGWSYATFHKRHHRGERGGTQMPKGSNFVVLACLMALVLLYSSIPPNLLNL